MSQEGKAGQAEVQEIANRTDTLSYALLAEINTFHNQRVKDMKTAHQHFLQEQITFYQKVSKGVSDLKVCLDYCENLVRSCGKIEFLFSCRNRTVLLTEKPVQVLS